MTVLVRADASSAIGSGHIMRTLELSRRLEAEGYDVVYLCKPYEGNLIVLIRQRGFGVHELPAEADEVEAIGEIITMLRPFMLVIDHYGIDFRIEKSLKEAHGILIFSYDDTMQRHCCDILLNQNIYASREIYSSLISEGTKVLAGIEYATIRSEFYRARGQERIAAGRPRLLVTLGGSDPDNITCRLLGALVRFGDAFDITVVVGLNNAHRVEVEQSAAALPHCRIIADAPDMAQLMAEADYAVTAAGQTTIESLFMELPSVTIEIAQNQRRISEYLQRYGLSISLKADFFPDDLYEAIAALLEGRGLSKEAIRAASQRIGTRSPVEEVNTLRFCRFSIRLGMAEDVQPLFELANDTEVRANSLTTKPIEWEEHRAWFAKMMQDPQQRLYTVVDGAGEFMGQLRFDRKKAGEALMSISIVPRARGYGVAAKIIRSAAEFFFADAPADTIEAVIRPANIASLKSFEKAGFKRVRSNDDIIVLHLKKGML